MSNGVNIEDLINTAFQAFGGGSNEDNSNPRDIINSFINLSGNSIHPQCDLIENEEEITVYLDVPGVDKSTLNIDFNNNKMIVRANREKPYEFQSVRSEIIYGDIEKRITIPMSVTSSNNVKVNLKNGVLKIRIDKVAEGENSFNVRLDTDE